MILRLLPLLVFFAANLFGADYIAFEDTATPGEAEELFQISYDGAFKRMLYSLLGLVALSILTLWLFKRVWSKRHNSSHETKKIKVIEKKVLSPKSMLYLIEVEGEKVLISESHMEVSSLHSPKKETIKTLQPETSELTS